MKVVSGNFIYLEHTGSIYKHALFAFRNEKNKLLYKYRTPKMSKDFVFENIKTPIQLFTCNHKENLFTCDNIKLGKFDGNILTSLQDPFVFIFITNILDGKWKIYTEKRKANSSQEETYIVRIN